MALQTHSSALIDVVLRNGDLIAHSDVISCPFSDHMFVVAALRLPANKKLPQSKDSSRYLIYRFINNYSNHNSEKHRINS